MKVSHGITIWMVQARIPSPNVSTAGWTAGSDSFDSAMAVSIKREAIGDRGMEQLEIADRDE